MAPLFKLCLLFLAFSLAAMDCNCTSVKREISGVQEAPKDNQDGQSTSLSSSSLKAFDTKMSWGNASSYCVNKGLKLANLRLVHTKEQLLQLGKDLKLPLGRAYWVDLRRDPEGDGLWHWGGDDEAQLDNNSPLWWTALRQPQNGKNNDRAFLVVGYGLMDIAGTMTRNVLCADP